MAAHEDMDYADALAAIVSAGLGATQMSGIQNILESIAQQFHCYGCVLWEASPGTILTPKKSEGGFFALAQWFENGVLWRQHDIPVKSATGHAIANELPYYAADNVETDPCCYKAEFLSDHDIRRVCVVPLRFADGAVGALNLFRQSGKPPFTEIDGVRIRKMANLLPALYETVRDEVAYRCSRSVNDLLQQAARDGTEESAQQTLNDVTQEFCSLLNNNLRCFDVSVYLEEEDKPELYVLSGSTLPDRTFTTAAYRKGEIGPTASALTYSRPIRILDLRQPKTFPSDLKVAPPNSAYVEYAVKETASDPESPLSFMAAPILAGKRLLGVLRCCVPLAGPTYFASREADLLMLLAGQIGNFVSDQRSRREVRRESQAYKVILESISSITGLVYTELRRSKPDEDSVLEKGLQAISQALPGEHWIGIGVRTDTGVYARRNGQNSTKGDQPREVLRLPWDWENELTVGRGVLRHHKQLREHESRLYTDSLPSVPNGVILAPIQCRDEFWVLEIVNSGVAEFPKHAIAISGLLGKQLGIYHDLLTTIVQLKYTQGELEDKVNKEKHSAKAQAQAMMDLEHQIRAPLRHARRRIPGLLKLAVSTGSQALIKQCQYLRGNLRRAGRVAGNARLFSRLASGQPIEWNPEHWSYEDIRVLLIEAAMDNVLISDEQRGVTFGVEEDSFSKVSSDGKVRLDKDLLDQVMNDLLDNAGKYSDPNTHVKIEVSHSKAYFMVTVTNKGLKISSDQVQIIKKRGERGGLAALVAGEGSGIGLWIADEIMKAHGGNLDIIPTTAERVTRIRLMFPNTRN